MSNVDAGKMKDYVVQNNETLMLIAYKIYGDYSKWGEIAALNPNINYNNMSTGTVLKYKAPSVVYNPIGKGTPYLINRGDTLGIISNKVYGKMDYWKNLWNNNRRLIKNPNLIFAGFTIYYLPLGNKMALNQ